MTRPFREDELTEDEHDMLHRLLESTSALTSEISKILRYGKKLCPPEHVVIPINTVLFSQDCGEVLGAVGQLNVMGLIDHKQVAAGYKRMADRIAHRQKEELKK